MSELAERIRALGLALGFDAIGFGPAAPGSRDAFLHEWLARGYGGEMDWLKRSPDERADPRRVLPGAKTAIAVALVYDRGEASGGDVRRWVPLTTAASSMAVTGPSRLATRRSHPRSSRLTSGLMARPGIGPG